MEHGDCSPFDTLLGSGKRLVETRRFAGWHRHSCDRGLMTIWKSKSCILPWLQNCGDVMRPVLHVVCSHFSPTSPVLECWISRMRSQWHFGNQIIVLPPHPAGAIWVRKSFHSGGSISVQGSSADGRGGAVLESSSGVAGNGSGCLC